MPEEDDKLLKYKYGKKYMRFSFIFYALYYALLFLFIHLLFISYKSLIELMNTCHNNPKTSSTTKINKHTPSVYS